MPARAVLSTVTEIVTLIKRAASAYEQWARDGDISAHRPCTADGCNCRFRHRHGWVKRAVVCGGWEGEIGVLRLFCPKCGMTKELLPEWLRPGSPYPWPWQEAAVLTYVSGPAGYRPVAEQFGVDYTLLWGWVGRLAAVAVALVGVAVRELLRQEPGARLDLMPVEHATVLRKARTAEKRQGLAHLPLAVQAATALRAACWGVARVVDDGGRENLGVLGWLSGYLALHGIEPALGGGSHMRSHSVSAAATP